MKHRALLRRAFPYVVIGIGGFALAYLVIYIFVLPSKIVPPVPPPHVPDSSGILLPIDTTVRLPETEPAPLPVTVPMPAAPRPQEPPVDLPDLTGMALPDARSILNGLRVRTMVTHDTSSFQPPNTVLRQSPPGGTQLPADGTVTLTVSYFPPEPPADTMPVQRGSNLPPIMPASPDTTRHP